MQRLRRNKELISDDFPTFDLFFFMIQLQKEKQNEEDYLCKYIRESTFIIEKKRKVVDLFTFPEKQPQEDRSVEDHYNSGTFPQKKAAVPLFLLQTR